MKLKQQILKLQRNCRNDVRVVSTMAVLLLFLIPNITTAQNSTDFAGMLTAEYQHGFGDHWDVNVKEDLRFDHDFSQYSRSKTSVGVDYKFKRNMLEGLRLGVYFDFINRYTDNHIYRNRGRLSFNITYKYPFRNWEFAFRTRYQMMGRDETTGYYNLMIQHVWRNRLSVDYHMKGSRWRYGVSGELCSELDQDNKLFLERILFVGNIDYRITRYQYLSVFVRDYRDIYITDDQIRTIYFGLGWKFKH